MTTFYVRDEDSQIQRIPRFSNTKNTNYKRLKQCKKQNINEEDLHDMYIVLGATCDE